MAPRIARKPVGFSSACIHGIAVIANAASSHEGSTNQRLPPCRARSGMVGGSRESLSDRWVPAIMALP